jgi:hypothetical protein
VGRRRPDYEIAKFWTQYIYRGRPAARVARVIACVAGIVFVEFIVGLLFGEGVIQARGLTSFSLYKIVGTLNFIVIMAVIFLVVDATLFSYFFVRELRTVHSIWPMDTTDFVASRLGVEGAFVDDWIDIYFVAKRTECIIGLIYGPFALIALLIASRSNLLDAYSTGAQVLVTYGISVGIVVACVLLLRWSAEAARDTATTNLTDALINARGQQTELAAGKAGQIELLLKRAETVRQGAFSPISHQPMIRALLLPLGTYGGSALLNYLSLAGI